MDLFEHRAAKKNIGRPLAERMRPQNLDEFIGQTHIAGKGTLIRNAILKDSLFSMILWGPPGCGKTTLANIIANETRSFFVQISAVLSGVKDIRAIIDDAKKQKDLFDKRTILFVDEIHRFNKSQQDAFLHHVESGLITLVGATTENPSFEVIPALMSRCRVITLNALSPEDMKTVLLRALKDEERGLGKEAVSFSDDALMCIVKMADGDVRAALNSLEMVAFQAKVDESVEDGAAEGIRVELDTIEKILQKKVLLYDKSGEEHYNLISALHKSLRGSDPDAAVYWLLRMLSAGEDPFYIARRMVRFATEDIGIADTNALIVSLNAMEAYRFLGYPEGELALVEAAVYLATAPKSNSIYTTYNKIKDVIRNTGSLPVPHHIRNAPTGLMKDLGYGKGYKYAHDYKEGFVAQEHLPESLKGDRFYLPTERGYEKIVKQRLEAWLALRKKGQDR
ncbi:MAG: replication-associated recombination protein A [Proteobacteria bacterium]|nr:replication-associated recombination protein A [Pseudomonadota bacterium]